MQCPSCHKEVHVEDKNIGALFTCPLCRSVYFINFDGSPDYGDFQAPSEEEIRALQEQSLPKKKNKKSEKSSSDHQNLSESMMQPSDLGMKAGVENFNSESVNSQDNFFSASTDAPLEMRINETDLSVPMSTDWVSTSVETESLLDLNNQSEPIQEQVTTHLSGVSGQFENIAQEIANFGNQQTIVSGLTYDLVIANIDSKESMQLLKEALEDSKFGWHVDDYIKSIKSGRVEFKNLSPVQAFVLARRIQFLDIAMEWKQNAIT